MLAVLAVDMPEIALGRHAVADALFQLCDLGESALIFARPYHVAADTHDEHAAGAGDERHAADLLLEGREQLLRHPGRAQQPSALAAILDRYDGAARVGAHAAR